MTAKTIAKFLILSAFAIAGANLASAQDFRSGGFYGGDNGFVGGYGNGSGYGNGGGYGYGSGYGNGAGYGETATNDMATGTESLPVTMSALSSARV
jgi:hypothetical protein